MSRQGPLARYTETCDHDVLPGMPLAIHASGGRIALTCVFFYLILLFTFFFGGVTSNPSATSSTVMSPVMQATGWRTVLSSVVTPLPVLLHVFCGAFIVIAGSVHRQVGGLF